MAPLCTAKIEEDCSARAMLWTPTMNIHQPTLHLFDQLSVSARMCVCVCWGGGGGVLNSNRLLFMESVITGLYLFFFWYRIVFPYRRWTACPHTLLPWSPLPILPKFDIPHPTSKTHYPTKQGNAIISVLWCSLLLYRPNASSPVCDVIFCAVEKVKYVGCFACGADFEAALISPFRKISTHNF